MRAKLLVMIVAAIPAMLSYDSCFAPAQTAKIFAAAESDISSRDSLAKNETQAGFDLNYCQRI
jgi:hypothetical protein